MPNRTARTIAAFALFLGSGFQRGTIVKGQNSTETKPSPAGRTTAQADAKGSQNQPEPPKHRHAYHEQEPSEPLPATLTPTQFAEDKATFVAYAIAGKIRKLLYQTPCYCPCDREESHESLLDCFTSHHGIGCPTCQKEVIFVYEQSKAGKDIRQIREGIENGDAWKLDVDAYAAAHYAEYK